jgi:hypothetical protein
VLVQEQELLLIHQTELLLQLDQEHLLLEVLVQEAKVKLL